SFHRPAFSDDTVRFRAITGFTRWTKSVRTSKSHYITLPLGKLIGESPKKTTRRLGLIAERRRTFKRFGRTAKTPYSECDKTKHTCLHIKSPLVNFLIQIPGGIAVLSICRFGVEYAREFQTYE